MHLHKAYTSFLILLAILLTLGREDLYAYRDACPWKGGFAAVGEGGRVDFFSPTGEKTSSAFFPGEQFTCILQWEEELILGGSSLCRYDGQQIEKIDFPLQVSAISIFRGSLIVASHSPTAPGGKLFCFTSTGTLSSVTSPSGSSSSGKPYLELPVPARDEIISISSSSQDIYAVTKQGEILHSRDLRSWRVKDFNEEYKGFYPTLQIASVAVGEYSVAIAGTDERGAPAVYTSTLGNIWNHRTLSYTERGTPLSLEAQPLSIIYDTEADRYLLLCREGTILTLPSCSHCNRLYHFPANEIFDIVQTGQGSYFAVGADSYAGVIQLD